LLRYVKREAVAVVGEKTGIDSRRGLMSAHKMIIIPVCGQVLLVLFRRNLMKKILLTTMLVILPYTLQAETGDIQLDVKTHTFSSGLQLLVVERHLSPTVSTIVRFKVGSADEKPGITGTAHLLEHMLFKGTEKIGTTDYKAEVPLMEQIDELAHELEQAVLETRDPLYRGGNEKVDSLRTRIADLQAQQKQYIVKDELWETYLKNGASFLNASTGNDGTQYYVSLPSNRLELWAYLESNRMAGPILREFYSERDVVYEERRLRTDNEPFGKLEEQLYAAAYTAHSYNWPVVGWASDLETVLREQVEDFFHQHYSPNNAVIGVVGDVKFEDVVKLVEKYFGNIPPSAKPVPPVTTVEPPQTGERRVSVEFDAEPQIAIGWHMPAGGGVDQETFDIIADLLTRGRTSRLYKSLVEEKQLVTSVRAYSSFTRFPDIFTIWATPKAPHTIEEVEKAIYEEIGRLGDEGPTEWELQRVRNQLDADFVRGLQSNFRLVYRLVDMQAKVGDWQYLLELRDKRQAVIPENVKSILQEYFTEDNRTVAYLVKPADNETASAPLKARMMKASEVKAK
jgi:predicted Zn-dependent peptidase